MFSEMANLQHVSLHESHNINISKKTLEDFVSVLIKSLPASIFFSLSMTNYLTFENFSRCVSGFLSCVFFFGFYFLLFINRLRSEALKYGLSLFATKMQELIFHVAFLAGKYIAQ